MLNICVVFEAQADAKLASDLADRIFESRMNWIGDDRSLLQYHRRWVTEFESKPFTWVNIDSLGLKKRLRFDGKFGREFAKPDAIGARRAIRVLLELFDESFAIVLIRDTDQDQTRLEGLEQARKEHLERQPGVPIVLGVAVTKRECWVLSGFIPCNDLETKLLAEERQYLGFDPTEKSHELTAKHSESTDKRSAKRVLNKLTGENQMREEECWMKTSLDQLQAKGKSNGLLAYLQEVEKILVPIMSRPDGRGIH